jgi:hypothetical protein
MDPNETLNQIRFLIAQTRNADAKCDEAAAMELSMQLCNKFEELDEWLNHDGHRPDDWQ